MIQYAMIRPDSSVAFISSQTVDESYFLQAGNSTMICVVAPANVDPAELVTQWFYRTAWVKSPPRPSEFHKLDLLTYQWVDPRTLTDHKYAKWEQIKKDRVGAINANLITPHGIFDSKSEARTSITDAVLMLQTLASMGSPQNIEFTLADNTSVILNTSQMIEVGLLLGQKVQVAHARSRVARAAIESATTLDQLALVLF